MADLKLSTERAATSEEVESLIFGTGALSWDWWRSVVPMERDGVAGYLFTHDQEEDPEGTFRGKTWRSEQQVLDAAAKYLSEGRGGSDAAEALAEDIGYLDASAADCVLQRAVFGREIYG